MTRIRTSILAFVAGAFLPGIAPAAETSIQLALRDTDGTSETEVYLKHESALGAGPFSLVAGGSVTDETALWVGIGAGASFGDDYGWTVDASFMPGLRYDGNGPDLGHAVAFRSSIGVSHPAGPGRVGFGVDRLSNFGLGDRNPGSNAIFLRYGFGR